MRHYETVFIINPDLSDEEVAELSQSYGQILLDGQAEMLKVDDWGRRRLAYEIKGFGKGYYILFDYASSDPAAIAEMERLMRLDDKVIRYMTILAEEEFDREAYEAKQSKSSGQTEDDDEDGEAAESEAAEAKSEAEEAEVKPEPEKDETEGQDESKDEDDDKDQAEKAE